MYQTSNSTQKSKKTQNTRNRTQEDEQRVLKNVCRIITTQQREENDNDTTYCIDKLH